MTNRSGLARKAPSESILSPLASPRRRTTSRWDSRGDILETGSGPVSTKALSVSPSLELECLESMRGQASSWPVPAHISVIEPGNDTHRLQREVPHRSNSRPQTVPVHSPTLRQTSAGSSPRKHALPTLPVTNRETFAETLACDFRRLAAVATLWYSPRDLRRLNDSGQASLSGRLWWCARDWQFPRAEIPAVGRD